MDRRRPHAESVPSQLPAAAQPHQQQPPAKARIEELDDMRAKALKAAQRHQQPAPAGEPLKAPAAPAGTHGPAEGAAEGAKAPSTRRAKIEFKPGSAPAPPKRELEVDLAERAARFAPDALPSKRARRDEPSMPAVAAQVRR